MTTRNPFPGMNPFFEQQWRDAHASLITYLGDALQERLPADLVARTEEEVIAIGARQPPPAYRPDVKVSEPWTLKEPAAETVSAPPSTPACQPVRVFLEEETERWIEVHDTTGRLITVLELLSPSNKLPSVERDHYLQKRRTFPGSRANLVEIDLVRQGTWIFPAPIQHILQQAAACYAVSVFAAERPGECEIYPIRLRERLPAIRIPLRPTDVPVVLDLQPLIDQCHERRRYHLLNYQVPLNPPLSAEDAAWANGLLRERHLL